MPGHPLHRLQPGDSLSSEQLERLKADLAEDGFDFQAEEVRVVPLWVLEDLVRAAEE